MARFAVISLLALGIAEGGRKRRSNLTETATARCGAKGGFMSTQIVNGRNADQCEWKWQVGLTKYSTPSLPFCGGMLVSEEWVLTAAHCVNAADFYVVAGDYKPLSPSGFVQKVAAKEVHRHPFYSDHGESYDYALVKLKTPVTFNACVGSVCLPTSDVAPGTTCWITGWGTLTENGRQATTLQEVAVDIISPSDCVNKYSYNSGEIDSSMICAQGSNSKGIADSCQGDSGGPLVCDHGGRWTLHGATSFGQGCAGSRYPGVWANVFKVSSWIERTMSPNSKPQVTCPDFADAHLPDRNGNCKCKGSYRCSRTRGKCPASSKMFEWTGNYFLPSCKDCKCR